jgi:hypothetical protein
MNANEHSVATVSPFLQARKAAEIEAAFGVKLVCPVDEFNASRHVGDDFPLSCRRRSGARSATGCGI